MCLEKPIDIVLLECGHQVVCEICVSFCGNSCPVCRQKIVRWIKTYTS